MTTSIQNNPIRQASVKAIKDVLSGGYPVVAIETWEEDSTVATLTSFYHSIFKTNGVFYIWDLQSGLCDIASGTVQKMSAAEAMDKLMSCEKPGFFIFKDMPEMLTDIEIQRRIKNIYLRFRGQNRFLIFTGAQFSLPVELNKDVILINYRLPDINEIKFLVKEYLSALTKRGIEIKLTEDESEQISTSLKGFTSAEAKFALNKACCGKKVVDGTILSVLHDEKEQLAKKDGVLEYVRSSDRIEDVGGLENLKDWLIKRRKLFSPEAAAAGLRPPRGLLMMGISGCGKSLSVKAISALWNLPLFRLDMNKVYSGAYGTPEGTFFRAIKNIEAVAPAILWIDEIEGGISSSTAKDGSTGSHIFSAFLTWMQEKSSDVFVAATANRIDLLPAEIIRKGRFDQVFFIDLPNDAEREHIFKVHLQKRKNDLSQFDLPLLSVATEFWNGAEIEHAVEAAMIEAFSRGEKMTQDDLYTIIRSTVPLSRTMAEQIKFIKNWASERAVSASKSDTN